jgi:hypothetical protein
MFYNSTLASVHKYLRIRDLYKELAFENLMRRQVHSQNSYNSSEFNALYRQFLESDALALALDAVITMYLQAFDSLEETMPALRKKVLAPGAGHWIQQERALIPANFLWKKLHLGSNNAKQGGANLTINEYRTFRFAG